MKKNKLFSAVALLALVSVCAQVAAEGVVPAKQTVGGLFLKGVQRRENIVLNFSAPGRAKVGATAGWTVAAADDVATVTAGQNITTATLVIPIGNLKAGDYITGMNVIGNIKSSSGGATITASLRYGIPGVNGPTDTAIASKTFVSRTYSALVNGSNVYLSGMAHAILSNANYYVLYTASHGVSVTETVQAINLTITAQ